MIEYKPTQGQLARLEAARLGASHTSAAVSEARAKLALAIAEDSQAHATLSRAIDAVLYGYNDEPPNHSTEHDLAPQTGT
ncbi:hypothetical protein ACSR0Z_28055 [Streptomyces viridosporus]